jgi:tetratricopeptide (TPR) repeat protein
MLATRLYSTQEEAESAWEHKRFTKNSRMIQKKFEHPEDISTEGAINLVKAVYERAIKDYESALAVNQYSRQPNAVMNDVENLYRRGYYTPVAMGERGVKALKEIIRQRADEREANEGNRIRNREYRRKKKLMETENARENQVS